MQFPGQARAPLGLVFNTTMSRADSALALAMMYGFENKNEARAASIAVTEAGLSTAAYCDAVFRFYQSFQGPTQGGPPGGLPNSNRVQPVGLAADRMLPDSPMVEAVIAKRNDKGEPLFPHGISKVYHTSEVTAFMRNALTGQIDGNAAMILSAPATYLARIPDLAGTRTLIEKKVRTLVITETAGKDVAAARKLLADWPTPIVLVPSNVGDALPFPAASLNTEFTWAPANPIVEAYRAYRPMPYDAPSLDAAAVLYAVRPSAELFKLSDPGTLHVSDDGSIKLTAGAGGRHRFLIPDPSKKEEILKIYVEIASSKPVPRQRFRPGQQQQQQQQQQTPPPKPLPQATEGAKPPAQ